MSPPANQSNPLPPPGGSDLTKPRRGFFGDFTREMLRPVADLIDRRISPVIDALEHLPDQIDSALSTLDQPQLQPAPRTVPLPVQSTGFGQPADTGHPADPGQHGPDRYLRPPGALPEPDFATACTRCGDCVHACPAHAIRLDIHGLAAAGLPYIVPALMPCVVCDSLACMHICPTGALKLVDQVAIRMGLARIDHATCLRSNGDDCRVCVEACPLGEKALTLSPGTNRVLVKRHGCVGCGVCEQACPTRAVIVAPRDDSNPLHAP